MFNECFEEIVDDGYNRFYESKETFYYDVGDSKYGYKLIVKVVDMYDYDGSDGYDIEFGMVILPQYLNKEVLKGVVQSSCNRENEIDTVDIWDYGLGISINYKEVDKKREVAKELERIDDTFEFVVENIDNYLCQPWNRVGNTWYDIVEHCLYNKKY